MSSDEDSLSHWLRSVSAARSSDHDFEWVAPRLHADASVDGLVRPVRPVEPEQNIVDVVDALIENESCGVLPVVSSSKPVGLLVRSRLIEQFSRTFSRELYRRSTVAEFMERDMIVVECAEALDDVARRVLDAGPRGMEEGYVATRDGLYVGAGSARDLLSEITARKEAQLFYMAHYDALTALPNRLLFMDRLERGCTQAGRSRDPLALLFVDVDRFKRINDSLGHEYGDRLLTELARRMAEVLRPSDTVARLAGDEFAVILPTLARRTDAGLVARKLHECMTRPVLIDDFELSITASIGIALCPYDAEDATALLRRSDIAMYEAKGDGRGLTRFFSDDMNRRVANRLFIENDLRRAVNENAGLSLAYQPIVDPGTGKVVAAEALARWNHPDRGPISPAEFIPVAEDSGLIVQLGEWVLESACASAAAWPEDVCIAVNVSARQLQQQGFLDHLGATLAATGLPPHRLILELTETVLLKHTEHEARLLQGLSALGLRLAIDDFGQGYSSLDYLMRFHIDTIKIDRAFIHDIDHGDGRGRIAAAAIAMARGLEIDVVAEGVETEAQLEFVRREGCSRVQGFLTGRPGTVEQLATLPPFAPTRLRSVSR
jgi:diguanylate cyclase (GGDEF)-like protein